MIKNKVTNNKWYPFFSLTYRSSAIAPQLAAWQRWIAMPYIMHARKLHTDQYKHVTRRFRVQDIDVNQARGLS